MRRGLRTTSIALIVTAASCSSEPANNGGPSGAQADSASARAPRSKGSGQRASAKAEAAEASKPKALKLISTTKVEQLIGDTDKATGSATRQQTERRFGIAGTDLGYSFEHDGAAYFLFGDTIPNGGDGLGRTTSQSSTDFALDFVTAEDSRYLRVHPVGEKLGGFEVPVSGLSLNGTMYVVCKTNHSRDEDAPTDISVLTRFAQQPARFERIREISRLPEGRFSKLSMLLAPREFPGLPSGGPHVLLWGTGRYRKSAPYLAVVPASSFESGEGTRYWSGTRKGQPEFSTAESQAAALVDESTLGDLSVTWIEPLGLFAMLYDSRSPQGLFLRTAAMPWGPWSEPVALLEGAAPELDRLRYKPGASPTSMAGPVIAKGKDPAELSGGLYAPYAIQRFTKVGPSTLELSYVVSTWNPYVVLLMKSELSLPR